MPSAEAKYVLTADDRTGQAFRSVQSKFSTLARTAAKVTAGLAAGAGLGFAKMANDAINAGDEIAKLARVMGVSTQNLAEMRGVIDLVGGSFDQYVQGIRRMQRSIVDFQDGSASMVDAFESINVSIEDLASLNPEQQLEAILRGMQGVENLTERNARAQEIFGRSAQTMINLVATGADEVAKLREEQAELGNTLSGETGEAMERFNDAIARMQQALQGSIASLLADNMQEVAEAMESIVGLIPDVVKGVGAVAKFVGGAGRALGGYVASVGALATGDLSGALNIARNVGADLFGGGEGEGASAVVDEQQTTNDILRGIARDGVAARAG